MRKICFLVLTLLLFLNITGCVFVVGGAAGAVGAYAVSRDAVQGETDKPYELMWSSAVTVSRIRGIIKKEDSLKGNLELASGSSRIWIYLVRITDATTQLKVAARTHHFPDLGLAQDIFVKIMEEAK